MSDNANSHNDRCHTQGDSTTQNLAAKALRCGTPTQNIGHDQSAIKCGSWIHGPPMVEFVAIFVGRCLGVDLKAHVNMFIKHCYNAIFHNPAYIVSQSHVISTACY